MKNKFIKVRCNNCKNEQIIFERATNIIKCNSCKEEIATPKGGKVRIKAKVVEILKP